MGDSRPIIGVVGSYFSFPDQSLVAGCRPAYLAAVERGGGVPMLIHLTDDAEVLDALLLVGFCGGYTSYSGFVSLAADGGAAITATTLVLCPLAALAGMRLSGGYPARSAGIPR